MLAEPAISPAGPIASWLARRSRWSRRAIAAGLGLITAAAMPPFNILPLLVPGLGGLILLSLSADFRRAFADGWWWGMGFFVPSLYWVSISMFVDIGQFWWMVPFAVFGLPAYLSLYCGAATSASLLAPGLGGIRIIAFAGWWLIGEWLRGHLFSGFPWLLVGYAWSGNNQVLLSGLQAASVVGIYGLSFLTVVFACLPATLDRRHIRPRDLPPVVLGVLGLAALVFAGGARLQQVEPASGTKLRIVSTDLPHRAAWDPAAAAADFRNLLNLAKSPGLDRVQVEIWPEGVVETALNRDERARLAVAAAAPPGGFVLTGTFYAEGGGPTLQEWNSISAVDSSGSLLGTYEKHHLVPFGEYVPLRGILPINQIADARFDFATGPGPVTLALSSGIPAVGPTICYEAIFPYDVIDEEQRPGWIVNVTDDGWFGRSIGPAQHFAIARVRAVEEGLPLVRAANGGISGVIDPFGRIVAALPIGAVGVLDADLPKPLPENPFYVKYSLSLLLIFTLIPILTSIHIVIARFNTGNATT